MTDGIQNADPLAIPPRIGLWVILRAPDSYGLVLFLLIVSFILAPVGQGANWLWVRVLVQGATMLFALHTSRVPRRAMRLASAFVAVSLVLALGAAVLGAKERQGAVEALL